ncbi:hypothetical protein J6590_074734 [Homalodisca vitripennis]|nr:hypothetical protein J6590_074734 [Homalodisca vitripennis]
MTNIPPSLKRSLLADNYTQVEACGCYVIQFSVTPVVSRSVLHEHLSGKRNNSLPLILVKICQYDVFFRARQDDSSVSARCCVCSAWTKSP